MLPQISEQAPKAPAPAVAPPAPIPVVAAPLSVALTESFGPPQVIALQRTAGNRAVSALLQRTKKGASGNPEPITAGDVTVAGGGGKPTVTGKTHAALSNVGPDSTRIIGPSMQVSAQVDLAAGVELASPLNVGYIQNMKSGDRIAVYTTDGTPAGAVVAEQHVSVMPGTRDAEAHFMQDANKNLVRDKNGNPITEADIGPPWFTAPQVFTADGPKSYTVAATDTPSFPVPLTVQSPSGKTGKLASVRGSESFEIALVVKDGNNPPVGLAAATWGIDWTMTVDPVLHTGTGAAGAQPQTVPADSVRPGAGLTHTDAQQWAAPVNDAEADAMALGDLLRSLPAARQYDLAAYHRMVGAIHRRNNPACFHASVKVDEDDNLFGSDTIEVSMEGVRGPKPKPPQKAGTGDNFMLDWQLYDLFDPHDITQGSRIKVTIARQGEKAQERSWVFRWGDTDALLHKFPGDSKYRLSMMLR